MTPMPTTFDEFEKRLEWYRLTRYEPRCGEMHGEVVSLGCFRIEAFEGRWTVAAIDSAGQQLPIINASAATLSAAKSAAARALWRSVGGVVAEPKTSAPAGDVEGTPRVSEPPVGAEETNTEPAP